MASKPGRLRRTTSRGQISVPNPTDDIAESTSIPFSFQTVTFGMIAQASVDTPVPIGLRLISVAGILVLILLAWLMSSNRRQFPWRVVIGGLLLQIIFAVIVFGSRTWTVSEAHPEGILFSAISWFFDRITEYVMAGTQFLTNVRWDSESQVGSNGAKVLTTSFLFGVLPTVIFFSALMSGLYYLGVMQPIVKGMAWVMQRTLGISGPESLSSAANVFIGHTEAPLVIKPYVNSMTRSELNCLMVGGFATITGGLMAVFVQMGVNAGHLLTASVISAPAAILIAKILQPEDPDASLQKNLDVVSTSEAVNLIDAVATGAADGMKLAINIAGMLLAFLALIAMANAMFAGLGEVVQWGWNKVAANPVDLQWSLEGLLGIVFWPVAFIMGIESGDCQSAGQLLGIKMVANEFVAYEQLSGMMPLTDPAATTDTAGEVVRRLSPRSSIIMTYALCGFSNFAAIAIQIGGIGGMAPERRADLAKLGLRAMLGGTIACCITGCIAGIML